MTTDIGQKIKAARKRLRIDQTTLAELSETSVPTLSRIERGVGNPTLAVLEQILNVVGLELCVRVKEVRFD